MAKKNAKKQSKKKPTALAEYAALMGRVAEYCAYERGCEAATQAARFDALHGGKEKRPSKAELARARRELAQAGEPVDDYNVNRRVVIDRAETAKPSAPTPDVLSIGQPLAMAQVFGDDPFPTEWQELHDELVLGELPDRVCAEIERRHGELVALFPCADHDGGRIEEAARSFNAFLLGLLKPKRTTPLYPTDERAIEILTEGVRRKKRAKYKCASWREIALSLLETERANGTRPYWERMMGKGCLVLPTNDERVHNAAKNWGKYLSYYSQK